MASRQVESRYITTPMYIGKKWRTGGAAENGWYNIKYNGLKICFKKFDSRFRLLEKSKKPDKKLRYEAVVKVSIFQEQYFFKRNLLIFL